jgi:hypothetical protein
MHARLQAVRTLPEQLNTPEAAGFLMNVIGGHPGFRSIHLFLQIGSRRALNVTLWDSLEDAVAATDRTRSVMGPRPFTLDLDEVYDVLATTSGPATPEEARVAQVSWFDGPRSAEQNDAMLRAGQDRIGPAIAAVPGLVATYVLCHPGDSSVAILTMATSTEALDRAAGIVFSTVLLPGEDPALLTGPDRVEVYKVDNQLFASAPVA